MGHWVAVKNILKYLRRTKDVFLIYGDVDLIVSGYSDASFQYDRDDCGDPRAQPDLVGESEPKPRGRSVEVINQIPFVSVLLNFSLKSVATRNLDLTRLADPSRSPVYSDISIISSKHLVYFIHFKFCNFAEAIHFGKPIKHLQLTKKFTTFTFNKMPLQKY